MTWLAIMSFAVAGFVLAATVLRLPHSARALLGCALLLGLAGYAAQGSPEQPSAPTAERPPNPQNSEVLIAARRAMFGGPVPPARYVLMADGFARKGHTGDAAGFLRVALRENPRDAEAWTALGNVLVTHAQGALTPPAEEAFAQAARLAPGSPAPDYFRGLAMVRQGQGPEALELWQRAVAKVPAAAPYRAILEGQTAQLEQAVRAVEAGRTAGSAALQP